MKVKNCRFILNTLNKSAENNNLSVMPKIKPKFSRKLIDADFNPYTAEITLNNITSSRILKPIVKKSIQHTTKHAEQFQIIARYMAGFTENINAGIKNFQNFMLKMFPQYESQKFNKKYYQQVINKDGVIKKGDNLFETAKKYVDALKKYPKYDPFEDIKIMAEEGFEEMINNKIMKRKLKRNNLLEIEARQATKEK